MRENNYKVIFFIIVIMLFIISIYFAVKNKKTYASEETKINKKNIINNNIVFGIIKYDTLDPILSKNQDIQYISKLIYKPIIDLTKDFKLKQSLAEEWNALDNKTYLIKLKENVYWNNEEKLTSKDILYTIDYIKQNKSIYNENIKNIENVEIVNDYMLKIYLKEPEEYFEYMLTFPIICDCGNVGTGDYNLETITDEKIILRSKNNNKSITIKVYDKMTDIYNAFIKGEIDFFVTNNINFDKYIGTIGYNKNIIIGRKFDYLKINLNNKVLKNKEVIQAISLLINKNEINKKLYNGMYCIAEFPLQYGNYMYNNNIKYEYNLNKAQEILENAGWVYNR